MVFVRVGLWDGIGGIVDISMDLAVFGDGGLVKWCSEEKLGSAKGCVFALDI